MITLITQVWFSDLVKSYEKIMCLSTDEILKAIVKSLDESWDSPI